MFKSLEFKFVYCYCKWYREAVNCIITAIIERSNKQLLAFYEANINIERFQQSCRRTVWIILLIVGIEYFRESRFESHHFVSLRLLRNVSIGRVGDVSYLFESYIKMFVSQFSNSQKLTHEWRTNHFRILLKLKIRTRRSSWFDCLISFNYECSLLALATKIFVIFSRFSSSS